MTASGTARIVRIQIAKLSGSNLYSLPSSASRNGSAGSRHRTDKIGRCADEIGRYPLKLAMIVAFSGSDWFSRKSRCASRATRT
jgi:hypothetical protein